MDEPIPVPTPPPAQTPLTPDQSSVMAQAQMPSSPAPAVVVICPKCNHMVPEEFSFCPNCGAPIKNNVSITLFSQIWIYGVSVFLPPLGFWPGIKYFRSSDPKAKKIGMIAIVLSVLSTVLTLWATFAFLNIYLNTFNSVINGTGGSTDSGGLLNNLIQ
jgi:hypothetical protein